MECILRLTRKMTNLGQPSGLNVKQIWTKLSWCKEGIGNEIILKCLFIASDVIVTAQIFA